MFPSSSENSRISGKQLFFVGIKTHMTGIEWGCNYERGMGWTAFQPIIESNALALEAAVWGNSSVW
jgi:hypothetical protein